MGNEAIGLGAIRAGVRVALGYPGTPSSEVLETIAGERGGGVYVEWSVNEKSALEVGAGAAMAGKRVLVTMKQVGLNVASDPLMSLNYLGVKGGMVVMAADDPGPISSQTEQDTRHFGQYAKLAVFDPSSPEEAYLMIADAFECSEAIGRPVLFRPTTRVCHSYASVEPLDALAPPEPAGFGREGGRWVIFPRLARANHVEIERGLLDLADRFSSYPGNVMRGAGRRGIASGGVSWLYVLEACGETGDECRMLKISTVPFPARLGAEFLQGLDEVLVIEELDPVIERELILLAGQRGISVKIMGKLSGHMPYAGENTPDGVRAAIENFLRPRCAGAIPSKGEAPPSAAAPALPVRPPVLCAGCPHRGAFFAVKEAARGRKAIFSGDIGCYTLGNALPLDMLDTCLCMGAGITMAQGLSLAEPDALNFAFIGDSTFFHTGIPGIINAVFNGHDIIVAVLDNSTTAMTGGQTHPGVGRTLMGRPAPKMSIYDVLSSIGVNDLRRVSAFDLAASKAAVTRAIEARGVRAVIFEGPCAALSKKEGRSGCMVDEHLCFGCSACVKKLGCPALSFSGKFARIDRDSCTGCGLCKSLCSTRAIIGGDER
jgi:indolepyruvate ferredoxin oxidoreductase alpha subunit